MDLGLILELLLMGAFGGFAAGMLGIGGGMILVPFITMIFSARGFPPALTVKMAIATSLATIAFTSLSSMRAHHKHGAVRWDLVKLLVPGIVVGAWIGPALAKQMDARVLALVFAAFVGFSATQMVRARPATQQDKPLPGRLGLFGAGGVIGVVSGIVGAGGGFISVPFMTHRGVRIHNAVATSAALGFPIALFGTLSNIYFGWGTPDLPAYSAGFVYLPALAVIVAASMFMAPVGARVAHRTPVARMKRIFGVVLYSLAAYMLWRGLRG
ncbi:sulfite exporter TauE/SafE family protein [Massilia sp. TS11]|uniref:sulfite exporter TauE/SafE family protein n=1 Tax=Massilia sp. TS11 TaxID=2908003 RepID=UPI001EDB0CF9|nr:sulfite exporter TauE/SafE family protein [Massilia sp. TS11]MCG2583786.1 sulfite exporter TauE/SafE family protein [Massilia sp. TS11]